ncbi:hypothetical protein AKO1_009608 [Acrasis kona]|uniref:Uncharacterized protein n=1 Tax=Acrasis kona TaxID=1008807 RepID=A0AAW2ZNI4_9EUKA
MDPCGHLFCDECIREWLKTKDTCPVSRMKIMISQLNNPPHMVTNMLDKLQVKCPACKLVIKRGTWDHHQKKVCQIPCSLGCSAILTRETIDAHLINDCPCRLVKCPSSDIGCTAQDTFENISKHAEACKFNQMRDVVSSLLSKINNLTNHIQQQNTCIEQLLKPTIILSHDQEVCCLTTLHDNRLVSGGAAITAWDVDTRNREVFAFKSLVTTLFTLYDGRLVGGTFGGDLHLWDANDGTHVGSLFGHTCIVKALSTLGDGRLISGGYDKFMCIWDLEAGTHNKIRSGHNGSVLTIIPILNSLSFATGGEDGTIRVWASTFHCEVTLLGHTRSVTSLATTPLGDLLISGSKDHTIRVWNLSSFTCVKVLCGHTKGVSSLSMLDDERIVSGGMDKTIRIWDIHSGVCIKVLTGHSAGINSMVTLQDGRLASASDDNTIRVWGVKDL